MKAINTSSTTTHPVDYEGEKWPRFTRAMDVPWKHIPFHNIWHTIAYFARHLRFAIVLMTLMSLLNWTCGLAVPKLLGLALDANLEQGYTPQFWKIFALLFLVVIAATVAFSLEQIAENGVWMGLIMSSTRRLGRQTTEAGMAITREMPTGEAVTTASEDVYRIASLSQVIYVTIATLAVIATSAIMLRDSLTLGLMIIIGLPIITAIVTLIIKPLEERQRFQRDETGALSTIATDAVTGLRILRGIGGEEHFIRTYTNQSRKVLQAGLKVASTNSILAALRVALPGVFVASIIWVGAVLALRGQITVGELVTFYGYTAFLTLALNQIINSFQWGTRGWIALKKIRKLMSIRPLLAKNTEGDTALSNPASPALPTHLGEVEFFDQASGANITPGEITALVSANPQFTANLAYRLAHLEPADTPVLVGGVELAALPLDQIRDQIIYQGAQSQLFTGTLRANVSRDLATPFQAAALHQLIEVEQTTTSDRSADLLREPEELPGDGLLLRALEVADCQDILDSLPRRLAGTITERGRSLSGGQRQRVSLARAVATQAEVLVLVEPTSAVDSHTESRIAQKLARERHGRTTVIVSASPLVLSHCDRVVFFRDGQAVLSGTHRELLQLAEGDSAPPNALAYRRVVARSTGSAEAGPAPRFNSPEPTADPGEPSSRGGESR